MSTRPYSSQTPTGRKSPGGATGNVAIFGQWGAANPNHHLWDNNGFWFVNCTIYPTRCTKKRIRFSVKTTCAVTARRRRDRLLAWLHAHGVLALPRVQAPLPISARTPS